MPAVLVKTTRGHSVRDLSQHNIQQVFIKSTSIHIGFSNFDKYNSSQEKLLWKTFANYVTIRVKFHLAS